MRSFFAIAAVLALCADASAQRRRVQQIVPQCSGSSCQQQNFYSVPSTAQSVQPAGGYTVAGASLGGLVCIGGVWYQSSTAESAIATPGGAVEALDEVNMARAQRGLRPYIRDASLTVAASRAAEYRAARRIAGHLTGGRGDFIFLPPGATANATGCAALSPAYGFKACAVYDSYTHAGAAKIVGPDGLLYSHLFVR